MHQRVGTARVVSMIGRAAVGVAAMLSLAAPAAAQDLTTRVDQARWLLQTPQGTALLDLLGDPAVRARVLAHSVDTPLRPPAPGSIGVSLEIMLNLVRERLIDLWTQLGLLPAALAACWDRLCATMPDSDRHNLVFYIVAFVGGGVACQYLFRLISRPWCAHFNHVAVDTPLHRLAVAAERLLYGFLLLAAFAAGSMGTFLLFNWPAATGGVILGYLWASLLVRVSLTVSRFFLAPGAERLRLLPVDTHTAWFWHGWLPVLTGIAALGWQVIMMLRGLGLPPASLDLLRQFALLALALCGITIIWTRPADVAPFAHSPRGPALRTLASCGLLLVWLLFLTRATTLAWSLLIIGAVPLTLFVLRNAAAAIVCGRCPNQGEEIAPIGAIAHRCVQVLVVAAAGYALIQVWHIDLDAVTGNDTATMRLGRGLFEAVIILMIADLLWLMVRALIDTRLNGAVTPIDDLSAEELRRHARLRTLLPVLRNFLFFFVLIIASLSALAAMGLQIGPLLAGAGVVGIAVGFGAQTLVRDVLSGVFFLLDDAFRVGELIESGGISGTVEAFSLRSVKLRHFKGPLHTVPFGDLKAITNYSRDWVNELMEVTIGYDSDLARVEQAIERVSAEIMEDEALSVGVIAAPHSIGVTSMTAPGIHMGIIVRTRPGAQFKVRAAVFSRVKAALEAEGIRFAV